MFRSFLEIIFHLEFKFYLHLCRNRGDIRVHVNNIYDQIR